MKMKKLISAAMSVILSVSALSVSAGAYNRYSFIKNMDVEKKEYDELQLGYDNNVLVRTVKNEVAKRYVRNIDPNWTDAQKAAYLYTNIVNQGRHRSDNSDGGDDDVLYRGMGICNTFTRDFVEVCQILGIRSRTASPVIKGVNHDINLVEIDGKWYELDSDGGNHFLRGTNNTKNHGKYATANNDGVFPTVEAYSPYNEYTHNGYTFYNGALDAHYFEYNGQWFRYDDSYIDKIDNSLYCATASDVFCFSDNSTKRDGEVHKTTGSERWNPACFAYDGNGHLYYDWKNSIYKYDAASNTSSKVFTLSKTIKGSDINNSYANLNGYGSQPASYAPFQWFGIDKYALYYVCLDGSYGSIPLGSDKTHLELTSESKTIGVGDYTFVAPMASTEDKCGQQVTFSTKDTDIIKVFDGGIVKGLKAGKATVTVSAYGRSNTYTVTVKDGEVTKNVIGEAFYLNKGSKVDLSYLFSFDTKGKIKYTSSDKSIVKVTESSGKSSIKGVKTGEAVITASCGDEKKILKVCVINSVKETSSISLSSGYDRNYLYGKGEAKNVTQNTEIILLSASLSKSSTDIVNWVGADGQFVARVFKHGFSAEHNQSLFFFWSGIGSVGKRTIYCITSNGKVKSYTCNVKELITEDTAADGTKVTKNYNTGEVLVNGSPATSTGSKTSETSYTKNDIENSFFFDMLGTGETSKESLEDFLADFASEERGSKSYYKDAKLYSLDTSVVKIVEKNGKHYVKCVNAEKGDNLGVYVIVVCNGKVEGLMFMFK